jgi:DNA-binding NarL/FixJ family response regulator
MSHAVRPIRVLAADADRGALAHMRAVLAGCADISLTGAAGDEASAVAMAAEILPDVVLIDDGPDAIRGILACSPASNVVVLTHDVDRARIIAAVDAGAGGYLLKDDDPAGLADAIRSAARGESPLAPRAARALISGHRLPRRDARLPDIEKRVLGLLARGCTDGDICRLLDLPVGELDRSLDVVIGALGVADRTQAALWAQRHGYDGADGDPGQGMGPFTRDPGRIRRPARPTGKRTIWRHEDAEECEDRARPVRDRRDGADAWGCRVR